MSNRTSNQLASDCRVLAMGITIIEHHFDEPLTAIRRGTISGAGEALKKAANEIERLERALTAALQGACRSDAIRTAVETAAVRPIDCKHERAKVQCPDCGIDFLGGIRGAPRDVPIWICSVCGGWNHVQDKFCTQTHAVRAAVETSERALTDAENARMDRDIMGAIKGSENGEAVP